MLRRLTAILLALLALSAPAVAEVYQGTTTALHSTTVRSEAAGILEELTVQAGQRVEAGEALASLRPKRTFATQDGTIGLIYADVGDSVGGEVLSLMPMERYTVHCTVDKAYQSAESTLVHSGETVYIKCTSDGTHRAIGVITQIDGAEYRVLTIGGELYVGETVYVYRDDSFTAARRVGIGTVVVSDMETYEADGELSLLKVAEGDAVERGQLLFEVNGGSILAPIGGIVASLDCRCGDAIAVDQIVAEIVPEDAICVEISVDERAAAQIKPGDSAWLVFGDQCEQEGRPGTVIDISGTDDGSGLYAVRIRPESIPSPALGMSAEVRI